MREAFSDSFISAISSISPDIEALPRPRAWAIAGGEILLDRPVIMGILNLTPDSFSDAGELPDVGAALERAGRMVEEGAGLLDVGGESTRPGARSVPAEEEIRRVVPVVEALRSRWPVPLSVDTRKALVARAALASGAAIVNDVSALAFDPEMAGMVRETGAGLVLMHMRGTPEEMVGRARYDDLEGEVVAELEAAVDRALGAGIRRDALVVDPGLGFAKTASQSLRILASLDRLGALGLPILVGPSRKSFLGEVLGVPPSWRAVGSAVACVMAYLAGARIFRVHDVAVASQALRVAEAIRGAGDRAPE
ncbi:MAG: dihydropteroate synthase [Gemmatimonadetes bacterium]|nr:dihydropteroate synthase [Gemmatimonadota bacterium]